MKISPFEFPTHIHKFNWLVIIETVLNAEGLKISSIQIQIRLRVCMINSFDTHLGLKTPTTLQK